MKNALRDVVSRFHQRATNVVKQSKAMIKTIIGQALFGACCFVSGWAGGRLKFFLGYRGPRPQTEVILLFSASLALGALLYIIDAMHNENAGTALRE